MMLRSHPDLELSQHISQVLLALNSIYKWHSESVITPSIKELAKKIVLLHDSGKGTAEFQEYIKNPAAYINNPMDKAHTPMSTLLTILLSEYERWDALDTLIVSAVILGHHRGLPTINKLRELGKGILPRILKQQILSLQRKTLGQCCDNNISQLNLANRPWANALGHLDDIILPAFKNLSIEQAITFRFKTQFLFSLLLEADKAFLAVKSPEKYINREIMHWSPEWIEQKIGKTKDTFVNKKRKSIRKDLETKIDKIEKPCIVSLTAPTGSGKTLLSATWLFKMRKKFGEKSGIYPKSIVVLPFLSVIDQTLKEYKSLLKIGKVKADGSWILTSHSLSDKKYKHGLEEETENFFIDTWRTELIITTYDQFLMSLLEPKTRYQMRFHNLCDALIVLDEVQSLPCNLWQPLEKTLKCLVKNGNTSILLMSATLPSIISDIKPLIENYHTYFNAFNRYKLIFRLKNKLNIEDFCDEVFKRRNVWLKKKERVLITLNTRKSARKVRDKLGMNWPSKYSDIPLLFISADVTPKDRLAAIDIIKQKSPCIVVSTQCIEAGVDIDMQIVIRDFAPLDSIIQIAGRCNRNGNSGMLSTVEIVDLCNDKGRQYADMIYDDIHLNVTRRLLENRIEIEEKEILPLANQYFKTLSDRKNTGLEFLKNYANWEENKSVRELLRGKEREKYTFIVLEQDIELKKIMGEINKIADRWKRRTAWRKIAGRIAKISINVYAKPGFDPQDIATEYLGYWILRDNFYSTERGLVIDDDYGGSVLIL